MRDRVVKIPYTYVRKGRRFYEPRGRMIELGFLPRPLGEEGEAVRIEAMRLYNDWLCVKGGGSLVNPAAPVETQASAAKVYPPGSVGECWQRFTKSHEWERLALSNRNKVWWPAWNKRIEPVFGSCDPNTITMEQISEWRKTIAETYGNDVAHKAMKIWRAFWKVLVAMRYTELADPSLAVRNTAPEPRDKRYSQIEVMRLVKRAWREGYHGLACIVMVCWDAGFSPIDARTLRQRHMKVDPETRRLFFDLTDDDDGRAKTGVKVIGTLSRFGDWLARRYLRYGEVERLPDAILFKARRGGMYWEARVSEDFRRISDMIDREDTRQLRDLRRSGIIETFKGDGDARDVSEKFGNSINRSNRIFKTYNPVDLEKVKESDKARVEARRKRRRATKN